MKAMNCAREREVAAAVQASRLEGTLREHVSACPVCREVASVSGFLSALARQPDATPLPDPADLYRRARLVERLFREPAPVEDAMRKLAFAEVLGILVSAMALGAWLLQASAELLQWFAPAPAELLVTVLASPQAIAVAVGVTALGASLTVLLAWPMLRVED